jgi:hypothetical protein
VSSRDPIDTDLVISALRRAGLCIGQTSGDSPVVLTASHPKGAVVVEVKRMGAVRIDDLEGRLAVGVLELRRRGTPDAVPMVCVIVDRLGGRAQRAAMRFMARYAPEFAWGLVDRAGGAHLEISSFGLVFDKSPADAVGGNKRTNTHLFSDLNRWLLKVLLLGPDREAHFGGPRLLRPVKTPTELHRVSSVSVEKAHRFFRTFQEAGFVRQARLGLEVVDREVLLERWLDDERLRPTPQVPMMSVFEQLSAEQIGDRLSDREYAMGGYYASAALDMLHSRRSALYLHGRGSLVALRRELDLIECSWREAQLVLVGPRNIESVARAAAPRDGVVVVDEIQAALDVVNDPARGHEQASFVVERLLHRWSRP